MTTDKNFKKRVRSSVLPGEGYAAARARLLRGGGGGDDGGLSPNEATRVMRDALTRSGLMQDVPEYEELEWSGGPPLFEEYIGCSRATSSVSRGRVQGHLAQGLSGGSSRRLPGVRRAARKAGSGSEGCGWSLPPDEMPFEYDEPSSQENIGECVTSFAGPGEAQWRQVRLQVGRTYDVIGGAHRGRVCTVVRLLRDAFMPSHAWVRFHDDGRTGEVVTDYLDEHLTPEALADPRRCGKCRGVREEMPVLELSGPVRPHLTRELREARLRASSGP